MKMVEARETTVYYCDICGEETSSLTEYYGCHHHVCSRHRQDTPCPVCAKHKEAGVSNAMDERRATREEATRVVVTETPATAQDALDRSRRAIDNLDAAVNLLNNCITHRRAASISADTDRWVQTVIVGARKVVADRRLSLGAASGFREADPAKCVAILGLAGVDSDFWTVLCDVVVDWLELHGYITFGKLRAVGGHRGD